MPVARLHLGRNATGEHPLCRFDDQRTPLELGLYKMIYGHVVEEFCIDGRTSCKINDLYRDSQIIINSDLDFLSSSSKKSFSPLSRRISTV